MEEAKIQLSAAEMQLMCNAEIILTKNAVLQKTKNLLEAIQLQMMAATKENEDIAPRAVFEVPPKISRGENYMGLPYLILDYPRIFRQEQTFAIRTFFWWGRFFSSTLQLSGVFKTAALPHLQKSYQALSRGHYISINTDPWQHHFEPDNFIPIASLTEENFQKRLLESNHIKIAAQWPLQQWHSAATYLFENWLFYLKLANGLEEK